MTVAHDHGYCCLQTKTVSGADFEGASDGAVACRNRHRTAKLSVLAIIGRIKSVFSPGHDGTESRTPDT